MIKKQSHQMREKEYWEHLEKGTIEIELKCARDLPDNPPECILKTLTEFEVDVTKFCFDGCSGLILDAGCGNGNILMHALKLFPDVKIDYVGLDFAKNMLKRAVARAKENPKLNASFFQENITDLPFKDDTFDRVVCVGTVITYLASLDEVEESLKEFYRVLKPDGILIIDFCNRFSHTSILIRVLRRPFPKPPKIVSPFWFRTKLKKQGFDILSYRGYDFKLIQGRSFVSRWRFLSGKVMERFSRFVEKKIAAKVPFI